MDDDNGSAWMLGLLILVFLTLAGIGLGLLLGLWLG